MVDGPVEGAPTSGDDGPYEDPYGVEALREAVCRPGGRWTSLEVVAATGSTNADLAFRARRREPLGAVLVADVQTAGRGRLGRTWTAPAGSSIAVSVLVRPSVGLDRWTWLPLLAGLAVSDGLRGVAGVPAVLKWPNDVLVGGRKLCGILAERVDGPDGPCCVVGLGINVGLQAADLPVPTATSLAVLQPDTRHPRGPVLTAVLAALADWLERFETRPVAEIAAAYTERCSSLGRQVEVRIADQSPVTGTAVRVDGDGRLVVATVGGERTFGAGDVLHLR